ncbi:hypothetical protein CRUP_006205 [Coryphaenoides rupestris]|nr:hypothetical protein CRUP_006205 [Coryphaenoides rupestris]
MPCAVPALPPGTASPPEGTASPLEPGGPHAIPRRHAPIEQLVRQGSFRGFPALSQKNSPFKRQLSLRLNDLPSTLQRRTDFETKNPGVRDISYHHHHQQHHHHHHHCRHPSVGSSVCVYQGIISSAFHEREAYYDRGERWEPDKGVAGGDFTFHLLSVCLKTHSRFERWCVEKSLGDQGGDRLCVNTAH